MSKRQIYFGESTDYYLWIWLGLETWSSGHSLDDDRFYRFVKMCIRQSPRKAMPGAFEQILSRAVNDRYPAWTPDYRDEVVTRFVRREALIWEYEQACRDGWPRPPRQAKVIERRELGQPERWDQP